MRTWEPKAPLTQTTVPSRAVTCWAAGSAATVVAAAAAEGAAAATASATRRRIDLRGMRAVWGVRAPERGPQGVGLRHLSGHGRGCGPGAGDRAWSGARRPV